MADSPVLWFEQIGMGDIPQVGGKNASLGELIQSLKAKGVRVPDGFATTADAYRRFLDANGIEAAMRSRIQSYRSGETSLRATGEAIGICGQGPSNHPEFAAFLVREGIDSISLNPDSYLRTVPRIAEAEKQAPAR